ncbi:hypothetical protein GCM10010326_71890 [Streptomyces xanthochromogenes]|uniref:Uncharacterized protein n=1 Tax=Streptomyces xanthochromogenes TaxID=67384 RepID=A0ABQ3AUA9_9ACTN|nr:hypothetical protein GCM10010326_71890 [Streptomyces xanthochromogenes]
MPFAADVAADERGGALPLRAVAVAVGAAVPEPGIVPAAPSDRSVTEEPEDRHGPDRPPRGDEEPERGPGRGERSARPRADLRSRNGPVRPGTGVCLNSLAL